MSLKGSARNAPCPCGSGKKYKKCCLPIEQADTSGLLWNKLNQTDSQLALKLLDFADSRFGPDVIFDAWEEFFGFLEEVEFEPESIHNQTFIPWYIYEWDVGEWFEDSEDTKRITIAGTYQKKYASRLSEMENRFISLNCSSAFSFFEIINCQQGVGFTIKDILSGSTLYITEKSGSQNSQPGDILYAKAIQYDDVGLFCGCGAIIIPPIYKPEIIDLRASMRRESDVIGSKVLHDWDFEIRDTYLEIFVHLHTPPVIMNTDGEPFLIHELTFKIDSPKGAFDALKGLAGKIPESELLEAAEFDEQNNLIEIDFPLVKASRKTTVGKQIPTLGRITIEYEKLSVFVNSEKRAKKIRKEIEKRLGDKVKFISLNIQTPEEIREEFDSIEEGMPEIEETDEMREVKHQIFLSHWKKWIDEDIPALGGLTPRQAVKDNDGREKVIAFLDDFERREKILPENKSQIEYIKMVRKDLGLD